MKHPVSYEQRRAVLDLRRRHSLGEVAKITGLPIGTVKTLVSRSGAFRDNPRHRALFSMPDIEVSRQSLPATVELPPKETVTGDSEVDAILWLRAVIDTGQRALIEMAMQAKERITTPNRELERRYTEFLRREHPGNMFATISSIGFADLDAMAAKVIKREILRVEAFGRFGDNLFAETPAESFCISALHGLEIGGYFGEFDDAEVASRFNSHAQLLPFTLSDCLAELGYWNDLYWLRHAVDWDYSDGTPETTARDNFVFGLLAEIRPRGTEEAMAVLEYLGRSDRMGRTETKAILSNLIGR
jgi:hypothetical protein